MPDRPDVGAKLATVAITPVPCVGWPATKNWPAAGQPPRGAGSRTCCHVVPASTVLYAYGRDDRLSNQPTCGSVKWTRYARSFPDAGDPRLVHVAPPSLVRISSAPLATVGVLSSSQP